MTSPAADESNKPELYIDEDWKKRVKAEDAALDQKLRDEDTERPTAKPEPKPQSNAAAERSERPPLPPADFPMLVGMLSTQALVGLGIIPNPGDNEPRVQLDLAKHMIDLLGVIDEKTKNNLDAQERALLDSTLHQLRLAYIERAKNAATAP
jgi:hypothetical protein